MKFKKVLLMFACVCGSSHCLANFGLGILLGTPSGVSFALPVNGMRFSGAIGSLLGKWNGFHIHGDYWLFQKSLTALEGKPLLGYVGVGGLLAFAGSDVAVGVRIPLGISYEFSGVPLESYGELVPSVFVIPRVWAHLEGSIGLRYWF